jgi:hypothetical protein
MDVEIAGSAELRRLAAQIRAEGAKGLGQEFGKALKKASAPVEREIRSEYKALPSGGGYSALFSKSLRFRNQLRAAGRQASYRLTTFANGTGERRDIEALEGGRLRHPVYGRSRAGKRKGERIANPWAVTTVKGGFHRRGTDGALDEAEREMTKVVDEYASRLIK